MNRADAMRLIKDVIAKELGINIPVVGDVLDIQGTEWVMAGFNDALPGWIQVLRKEVYEEVRQGDEAVIIDGTWAFYPPLARIAQEMNTLRTENPERLRAIFQKMGLSV